MERRRSGSGRMVLAALAVALTTAGCFYHSNVPWDAGSQNDPVVTETFRIGPYDLAGINQPGWEVLGNRTMPKPSGNVAIKRIDYNVVDGAGNTIGMDLVHLHHIVMIDQSQPDPICPEVGTRFSGTGAERTPTIIPGDYAYLVDAADTWASTFHIHTTTATPASGVYIEYKIQYEPVTETSNFRSVTPYFLDVTGCWSNSASLYDVPGGGGAGSVHLASATYTAPRDGIAVYAGGHIHAGSHNISLTRAATGEDYCTARALYAPGGHPNHPNLGQLQKITSCKLHSEVNAGEQFILRARYDNEYPVAKAMGIMLVFVWHPDS